MYTGFSVLISACTEPLESGLSVPVLAHTLLWLTELVAATTVGGITVTVPSGVMCSGGVTAPSEVKHIVSGAVVFASGM